LKGIPFLLVPTAFPAKDEGPNSFHNY